MNDSQLKCPQCGAVLGAEDLQLKACRYCGAMHPHVARAAEKVELVKQMMAPGPGGVPAAMQGMVAPWAAMMPNYGVPPQGHPGAQGAPPPVMISAGGVVTTAGQAPPQFGGPMGHAGPVMPMYGAPAGFDGARAVGRGIGVIVFVIVAFTFVLLLVGGGLLFFLVR